jgi:hypothetical protein
MSLDAFWRGHEALLALAWAVQELAVDGLYRLENDYGDCALCDGKADPDCHDPDCIVSQARALLAPRLFPA